MDVLVLNKDFESVCVIDVYKSLIWTDRHNEYGDFEVYIPIANGIPSGIQKNYYLWSPESEHLMIIESINIETDVESDSCFAISGRSLESLLTRRIVWNRTDFTHDGTTESNLQNGIKRLLVENVINPTIGARKIDNFIFEASDDERITSLTFEAQYHGEELYKVISNLCIEKEIGFKITLNEANQFVFKLYKGEDRSYEQTVNPYVVFSPTYDNLLNSNYLDSVHMFKNVALVVGEEDETNDADSEWADVTQATKVVSLTTSDVTGINRREVFVDASGLSANIGTEDELTVAQYEAHLKQKGIDALIENAPITAFEGEVNYHLTYQYGKDYFIGDVVQVVNEYGHEGRASISEFVRSYDQQGMSAYPTFKTIQEGVYE